MVLPIVRLILFIVLMLIALLIVLADNIILVDMTNVSDNILYGYLLVFKNEYVSGPPYVRDNVHSILDGLLVFVINLIP